LGNVTLTNLATFLVELNGTNVGTSYDQLNVIGTVNLANCALSISLGYTPALGDVFTIIANDATDTVTGTFAALPEGARFITANTTFQITYAGGSGNDVVLTVVP